MGLAPVTLISTYHVALDSEIISEPQLHQKGHAGTINQISAGLIPEKKNKKKHLHMSISILFTIKLPHKRNLHSHSYASNSIGKSTWVHCVPSLFTLLASMVNKLCEPFHFSLWFEVFLSIAQ